MSLLRQFISEYYTRAHSWPWKGSPFMQHWEATGQGVHKKSSHSQPWWATASQLLTKAPLWKPHQVMVPIIFPCTLLLINRKFWPYIVVKLKSLSWISEVAPEDAIYQKSLINAHAHLGLSIALASKISVLMPPCFSSYSILEGCVYINLCGLSASSSYGFS